MTDYYEYSVPELTRILGSRFREYRLRANLTQKEVADHSGLTVATVHRFENGTARNISLGTFILLLKSIELLEPLMNEVLMDLPESPYLYKKDKKTQRIRHKNQQQ